jgi:ribosomal protein S19E (S16A)
MMDDDNLPPSSISWTLIEEAVARDLCVRREYLTELCKVFLDDGDVTVFGEENQRGGATEKYDHSKQQKISRKVLLAMAKFIDQQHSEGRSVTVTNRKLLNWLKQEHDIEVSRKTVQHLKDLGLSWSKVKPKKRTLGSFGLKAIRDYLIALNQIVIAMENGNPENLVFVFIDESYVHTTHAHDHSYLQKGKEHIERTSSKGKRLIILHAITIDGPLAENGDDGKPVSHLEWKGDTPHPTPCNDAKRPFVANAEELKIAFVTYLSEKKPELRECQVERVLCDRGHRVLWTPPYCPELQPIGLFWAAGKNHVAMCYVSGRTVKETVSPSGKYFASH